MTPRAEKRQSIHGFFWLNTGFSPSEVCILLVLLGFWKKGQGLRDLRQDPFICRVGGLAPPLFHAQLFTPSQRETKLHFILPPQTYIYMPEYVHSCKVAFIKSCSLRGSSAASFLTLKQQNLYVELKDRIKTNPAIHNQVFSLKFH